MIRIVHLSDIHLNKTHILDIEKFIIPALTKDLLTYNKELPIDLIFVSGDLIDKGGESFEKNINLAFYTFLDRIITPITDALNLGKDRVLFAPGNHDIDRTADKKLDELGLKSLLHSTEEVNLFIDSNDAQGIKRIFPFKIFEKEYYENYREEYNLSNYQSCFKLTINEQSIGITCFNSAWRCYESTLDKNNILLGERQVSNARNFIENCDVKMAILHHPLDWMAKFDNDSVSHFIQKDYDMLFYGHVHEGSSWSKTNMYGNLFVSIAPSNWKYYMRSKDKTRLLGYSIIDYDQDNLQIIVHNRQYSHNKSVFDPNTNLGDEKGICYYTLLDSKTQLIRSIESSIVKSLSETRLVEINDHLLTSHTDTLAPKDLKGLFVMPRIVDRVQYDIRKRKDEKVFSIEDLINSNDNIIIFGMKESGKTILLDKLLLELVTNYNQYHKLPVFIDFEDATNKRYETIICNYLNISIKNINEFLLKHKITLLIDNISFDKHDKHKLSRLDKFLEQYENVNLICASNILFEGDVPIDFYDNEFFASFKIMHIKSFQSGQIRELIKKWFSNNESYDISSKLNKIVKVLISTNLPRTPMSISLFLWIIEQTGNYKPVNHATMLENFIQRLFKKLSKKDIYSEEFDYKNKERLLSEVAFYMFEKNLDNYKLPFAEVINFIDNKLKEKKFDFDSSDVSEYFLSKGILIKEYSNGEKSIRFRFNCFFEYFLMKKMDFDSNFREYALQEDNYLHFYNEIDYYTGIKRDQSDILTLVVSRMNEMFNDILKELDKYEIDDFFKIQKSLISKLDNGFLKKLKECGKPDEKAIDEMTDGALMIPPEKGIEMKKLGSTPSEKFDLVWTLAARVLKNTEETTITDLKLNSYKDILRCAVAFTVLYKLSIEKYLLKCSKCKKKSQECRIRTNIIKNLMPLVTQIALYCTMATGKLSVVIREKIIIDNSDSNISDLEKFFSIFLYSDIKAKEFKKYLNEFIKNIKHQYMFDIILYKILLYYYLKSKSKASDLYYESIIAELLIRSKKASKAEKSKVMKHYKKQKEMFSALDEDLIA